MIWQLCIGIFLILMSSVLISEDIIVKKMVEIIQQSLPLTEDSLMYKEWSSPMRLNFTCYLFNVTNPDEVMNGENPKMVEYGPFTYDEILEKQVIDIDEENDEIKYTTRSTYSFNRHHSVNFSKHDKVTILNPAYIGTILTLASLPSDFMKKYGDNIPKLFTNHSSIFLKARATDILFSGVKVTCNLKKFPELNLICKTMKAKPPPVLKATENEDVYLLSIFQRQNGTIRGPYTVSRGVKNITKLGDITSYLGERVQTIWGSDSCNTVRGTDTVTWPPLVEPLPFVSTFIPDFCRTMEIDYDKEVSIHGITGSKFTMNKRLWFLNETQCYCPIVNEEPKCLPQGLMDVSECQKVPIILSEPHFLHADPALLNYARGLTPNEDLHKAFVVIEPYTGTPLSGLKKIQLSLKLTKQPVKLLSNVSEGVFPILWLENGSTPTLLVIAFTYQILRLIHLIRYLQCIPLIFGIYIVFLTVLFYNTTQSKTYPNIINNQSISILSNSRLNDVVQRTPQRRRRAFQ